MNVQLQTALEELKTAATLPEHVQTNINNQANEIDKLFKEYESANGLFSSALSSLAQLDIHTLDDASKSKLNQHIATLQNPTPALMANIIHYCNKIITILNDHNFLSKIDIHRKNLISQLEIIKGASDMKAALVHMQAFQEKYQVLLSELKKVKNMDEFLIKKLINNDLYPAFATLENQFRIDASFDIKKKAIEDIHKLLADNSNVDASIKKACKISEESALAAEKLVDEIRHLALFQIILLIQTISSQEFTHATSGNEIENEQSIRLINCIKTLIPLNKACGFRDAEHSIPSYEQAFKKMMVNESCLQQLNTAQERMYTLLPHNNELHSQICCIVIAANAAEKECNALVIDNQLDTSKQFLPKSATLTDEQFEQLAGKIAKVVEVVFGAHHSLTIELANFKKPLVNLATTSIINPSAQSTLVSPTATSLQTPRPTVSFMQSIINAVCAFFSAIGGFFHSLFTPRSTPLRETKKKSSIIDYRKRPEKNNKPAVTSGNTATLHASNQTADSASAANQKPGPTPAIHETIVKKVKMPLFPPRGYSTARVITHAHTTEPTPSNMNCVP